MIRQLFLILFFIWIGVYALPGKDKKLTVKTHLIPVAIEDRSLNVRGPVKPQTGIKFPTVKVLKQINENRSSNDQTIFKFVD